MRPRARAQADRLADVQRPAVGVAEDVDAGVLGQRREVGPVVAPARGLRRPSAAARLRGRSSASASATVRAFAHSRGSSAHSTRAHVSASGSARCVAATSIPSASASEASPRRRCSGASRRASATVHITGGSGHSSSARSNACLSTPTSKRAEWATRMRPRSCSASSGSTCSGGGASSTIACVIPVKRWMPRPSGSETPTSELQRSCSSPPPTSTAPTSVSSQRSFGCPFVSVSTARNSAPASRLSRRAASGIGPRVIRLEPDGMNGACSHIRRVRLTLVARCRRPARGAAAASDTADYQNKPRPPAPINVTAAIDDDRVRVSPVTLRLGAGRLHHLQPVAAPPRRSRSRPTRSAATAAASALDAARSRRARPASSRSTRPRAPTRSAPARAASGRPRSRSARGASRRRTSYSSRSRRFQVAPPSVERWTSPPGTEA